MFEVRASYPMGDDLESADDALYAAAGGVSHFSGAGCDPPTGCVRDHGWVVGTFAEARLLKSRLDSVPGVAATIREK